MQGLMLMSGSEAVTRQQVEAIPVPEATDTWSPVPYADVIGFMHEAVAGNLGLPVRGEGYGLNHKGDQMFALLSLDTGDGDTGLSIGLRQSYNKSLALGTAVGAQVFICDNLCFSGSAFKIVRKNTLNVWRDFQTMMRQQVMQALGSYASVKEDNTVLKGTQVNQRRGFAILGVALGEGILTPTQSNIAISDWKKPRHEEFAGRNLWSLYNCMTEGLKKGPPGTLLNRHAAAHDFMTEMREKFALAPATPQKVLDV